MAEWSLTEEEYAAVEEEVVGLLVRLIQVDTSNPPGDVSAAARVLAEYFRGNGVEPTIIGEQDESSNCLARLAGERGSPSLLMLGHLDVVPASADEWSEPPFSGRVKDGYVWGRGALDMKNQVAAQAVALVRLARAARSGERLQGDLVFAATADEENGNHCGAKWLVRHKPDLVCTDFVINEGGAEMVELGKRRLYTISTGEKGYATCRITVHGRPGHGSAPIHHDNAIVGMAEIIRALNEYQPKVSPTQIPTSYIDRVIADPQMRARIQDPQTAQAAVRELAGQADRAVAAIEPLLGLTFAPTIVRAGEGVTNVIPSTGEITVDCRLLPGQSADDVRREIAQALADVAVRWELELLDFMGGNESAADTGFCYAIAETLKGLVPCAEVVCTRCSGFSDSSHFRTAFPGIVAYGFCPYIAETGADTWPRFHGIDERITVRDLVLQTVFTERLASRLLVQPHPAA